MNTAIHTEQLQLAKRALLALDAQVRRVVCESGTLWITQDRDLRDLLLEPGEAFTPQPGQRAILYALGNATLTLERATQTPARLAASARAPRPATRTLVLE